MNNAGQTMKGEGIMTTHKTGTREQWLKARLELFRAEKELTRRSDEVALKRQELPWVPVNKGYRFEIDKGSASLADLFQGRSQLLVYHFMFGPEYTAGCATCSTIADGFDGFAVHLANHDVTLSAISLAPLAKLLAYKRRMGWTFPWASSRGHDRNRRGHLHAPEAGHERVRARGRRRLPNLFHLCARTGRPLGHVPVARPCPQGAQRDGRLVEAPRRVRQALSEVA